MTIEFIERRVSSRRLADLANALQYVAGPSFKGPEPLSEAVLAERKPLSLVLGKSQEVKFRISKCSEELSWAHDLLKNKLIALSDLLTAEEMLADSLAVKVRVKECADDLNAINTTLAQTIDALKHSEMSLADALKVLALTEAALATAEVEKQKSAMLALYDHTTGLPNRRLFDDRLTQAIASAERHQKTLAVMFLDVDRFKGINDTLGHAVGDEVLKEVARRLSLHTRDEDTACRNGGDEFLFLLMNPQGRENIERVAVLILRDTAAPVDTGQVNIVINASIGIAVFPDNGTTGEELIKNADSAMYKAKHQKTGCAFF